jgi:hypothetical protein
LTCAGGDCIRKCHAKAKCKKSCRGKGCKG